MADVNEREMIESWLPVGFRFKPTDEELVVEYLIKKIKKLELPFNRIREVELYKYATPEKLTEKYELIRESEWYFFSPRDRKYPNGSRAERCTPGGYWQPSITQQIYSNGRNVGSKTILNFYEGPPRGGKRTDWLMHEYIVKHSTSTSLDKNRLDDCILCKVYKKAAPKNQSSSSNAGTKVAANEVGNKKESSSSNTGNEVGKEEEPSSSNTGNNQMGNYQLQQQPVHQQNQGIDLPFHLEGFMEESTMMIPDQKYAIINNQLQQEAVHQPNRIDLPFHLEGFMEESTMMIPDQKYAIINNQLQQEAVHQPNQGIDLPFHLEGFMEESTMMIPDHNYANINNQLQQESVHQQNQGFHLSSDQERSMIQLEINNLVQQQPIHQQNQGFHLSSDQERSMIQLEINNLVQQQPIHQQIHQGNMTVQIDGVNNQLQQQPIHQQINQGNMTVQIDGVNNQLQQQQNISSAPPIDHRRFDGNEIFNGCDDLIQSQVCQQYQSIWDCGDGNLFWV